MKAVHLFALTLGLALLGAASAITNVPVDAPSPGVVAHVVAEPAAVPAAVTTGQSSALSMILPIAAVVTVLLAGPFVRRAFRT